jgi:hypothetical protein
VALAVRVTVSCCLLIIEREEEEHVTITRRYASDVEMVGSPWGIPRDELAASLRPRVVPIRSRDR